MPSDTARTLRSGYSCLSHRAATRRQQWRNGPSHGYGTDLNISFFWNIFVEIASILTFLSPLLTILFTMPYREAINRYVVRILPPGMLERQRVSMRKRESSVWSSHIQGDSHGHTRNRRVVRLGQCDRYQTRPDYYVELMLGIISDRSRFDSKRFSSITLVKIIYHKFPVKNCSLPKFRKFWTAFSIKLRHIFHTLKALLFARACERGGSSMLDTGENNEDAGPWGRTENAKAPWIENNKMKQSKCEGPTRSLFRARPLISRRLAKIGISGSLFSPPSLVLISLLFLMPNHLYIRFPPVFDPFEDTFGPPFFSFWSSSTRARVVEGSEVMDEINGEEETNDRIEEIGKDRGRGKRPSSSLTIPFKSHFALAFPPILLPTFRIFPVFSHELDLLNLFSDCKLQLAWNKSHSSL